MGGSGTFETWATLGETLEPLLSSQVSMFLRWSDANAQAVAAGKQELSVNLGRAVWKQSVSGPQRYHAKSLAEIRRKYAAVSETKELSGILGRCGCLELLSKGGASKL